MRIGSNSGWKIAWTFAATAATTQSRLFGQFFPQQHSSSCLVHSLALRPVYKSSNIRTFYQHRRTHTSMSANMKFVDIGANLLDERYTDGIYFGKKRHEEDFDLVLERSIEQGVTHLILTAGTLRESTRALELVEKHRANKDAPRIFLGCTVGVHPTRCKQEFVDVDETQTAETILDDLAGLLERGQQNGCVVAIGEFGLDYDRLEFSPKDVQLEFFRKQLDRFLYNNKDPNQLPLFLHNRSVGRDLLEILLKYKDKVHPITQKPVNIRGVVHSFDDSLELANEFIDLGLYIGLNGCSLKTEENLAVVKELPLDKILLETDCPYCEIKATHAGHHFVQTTFAKKPDKKFEMGKMVKGRNEPNQIVQVAEVIAGAKGLSVEEVAEACYRNSMELYGGFAIPSTAVADAAIP